MRNMLYLTLLSLLFACNKGKNPGADQPLTRKWKLTVNAYSIGGPLQEHPVTGAKQTVIEFKENGTFTSTAADNPHNRYTADAAANTVTLTGNGAATVIMRYAISGSNLTLTPIQPICIEGCYTKYITAP